MPGRATPYSLLWSGFGGTWRGTWGTMDLPFPASAPSRALFNQPCQWTRERGLAVTRTPIKAVSSAFRRMLYPFEQVLPLWGEL